METKILNIQLSSYLPVATNLWIVFDFIVTFTSTIVPFISWKQNNNIHCLNIINAVYCVHTLCA